MSDRRPTETQDSDPNGHTEDVTNSSMRKGSDPLELIELRQYPDKKESGLVQIPECESRCSAHSVRTHRQPARASTPPRRALHRA